MELFFDIETFAHDTLIVFKDEHKKVVGSFWNDFDGVYDLINKNTIVGYNNYFYDDYILSRMLHGDSPEQLKKLNDKIIRRERFNKYIHKSINSLDAFQQIDVSMPGLKKIEGNMGRMILESSVDFDIDRPLTDQEREEVFEYCSYDVDTTIDVYKMRRGYFTSKRRLVDMLGNPRAQRWNTTTISANLLIDKPLPKWASIRVPEWMMDLVPTEVQDLWLEKSRNMDAKLKSMTIRDFDNDITFAFGGLHGEHRNIKRAKDVILLDVTSMYPNIIIALNALGPATETYKKILKQRLEIKHTDKELSDALKLILNSVYGNLKNKYSILFNPRASLSVCVYGQIALYELCRRLAPFGTIININTDGVAFTTDNDAYKTIWKEWEKDFNLNLEEERFDEWVQKDVNNYIATQNGEVTTKGGDVSRYQYPKLFSNNSNRIIDIALVNKLLYKKDPVETLMENRDKPELFQYILQAGGTYRGTFDTEDRQYNKINRVFAVKRDGVTLQKKRMDDGLVRFPDAPDKMLVWNDSIEKLDPERFHNLLDLNHYYQLINKKLSQWTG